MKTPPEASKREKIKAILKSNSFKFNAVQLSTLQNKRKREKMLTTREKIALLDPNNSGHKEAFIAFWKLLDQQRRLAESLNNLKKQLRPIKDMLIDTMQDNGVESMKVDQYSIAMDEYNGFVYLKAE